MRRPAPPLPLGFLALAAAVVIGGRIVVPVSRLREHALVLAAGKLTNRIEVSGAREIEELAEAFNQMAGEIQVREERFRAAFEHAAVQCQALLRRDRLQDGLPRQLVAKCQRRALRDEHAHVDAFANGQRLWADNRRQQRGLDPLPNHSSRFQHGAPPSRQASGARKHGIAHRGGDATAGSDGLGDEEGVAAGLAVEGGGVEAIATVNGLNVDPSSHTPSVARLNRASGEPRPAAFGLSCGSEVIASTSPV